MNIKVAAFTVSEKSINTWFNIFVTSRDIENLGKLIMGIFADL